MIRYLPDSPLTNRGVASILGAYFSFSDTLAVHMARRKYLPAYSRSNPLISVLLPTYNRANILLERGLPSVANQSYRNIEIIIIDDGSSDNTEALVKDFGDPRIRFFRNSRRRYRYPNKAFYHWLAGPVEALNLGLSKVTGDWIARIDDDDNWTSDHLSRLLDFAIQGKFEFVSSHLEVRSNGESRLVTGFDDPLDRTGIGSTQTWLYDSRFKFIRYNINCWRKGYFRNNDTDLQYRLWAAGLKIGYLQEVTAFIEPRPGEYLIGSKAYLESSGRYEEFYGNRGD